MKFLKDLSHQSEKYCAGSDAELAYLKEEYHADYKIRDLPEKYDPDIEL